METFVPTYNAGRHFFTGWYDPRIDWNRPGPFQRETLTSTLLLVSDTVLVDQAWRAAYDELFGATESVTAKVLARLSDEGVLREVDPRAQLDRSDAAALLGSWSVKFLDTFADHFDGVLDDQFRSAVAEQPTKVLLREVDLPDALRDFDAYGASIVFEAVYLRLVAGVIGTRIRDPAHSLGVFRNVLQMHQALNLTPSGAESAAECGPHWLVAVCDEVVPRIPLFVSKAGEEAPPERPFEVIGGTRIGAPNIDEAATLKGLDRLLDLRRASVARDLRHLYSELLDAGQNGKLPSVRDRSAFHRQWSIARAELRRKLEPGRTVDRWTDALTIPSALGSLIAPGVGAIPVASWAIARLVASRGRRQAARERPRLIALEQIEDLALAVRDSLE